MGFGDVRFSFLLGCFLGWLSWWHLGFGLFAGFLYGAVVGVALMALGKRGRRQHIPFGPFLAAGALTIILIGQPLIDAYRDYWSTLVDDAGFRLISAHDLFNTRQLRADTRLVRRLTIVGKGSCRDVCGTEVKGWLLTTACSRFVKSPTTFGSPR